MDALLKKYLVLLAWLWTIFEGRMLNKDLFLDQELLLVVHQLSD